jgi:hypothetical protein
MKSNAEGRVTARYFATGLAGDPECCDSNEYGLNRACMLNKSSYSRTLICVLM